LVYLDRLEDSESIAIGIIQLITHPEKDAPRIVQGLKQQNLNSDIIELIEAVLVAKFKKLSREEIEAMFALSDLKNTRVYQDALQEGEQKGWQKGLTRGLTRGLQKGWKKGKQEGKQEGRQQGRQEGKQEGKQEIALNLLKVGMSVDQVAQVTGLTIEQVRQLH
jgi:predicted transposase/invertase (TIGR01784 family)